MSIKHTFFQFVVVVALASEAAAQSSTARVSNEPAAVQLGNVVSVRSVTIQGDQSAAGTVTGGVAGAALGSQVGGGSGRVVAGTVGAVAGARAGQRAGQSRAQRPGVELIILLENGQQVAVFQEGNSEQFLAGDRVQVISGGGNNTRVQRVAR